MRPLLIDLFCGAGGAAVGYHRAGFDVLGIDIAPQPRYPFDFEQMDALEALKRGLGCVAAIHASPPCQRYMTGGTVDRRKAPDLLGRVRARLVDIGKPWVIENVPGAPIRADFTLCGSMFGLQVRRHRLFETSWRGAARLPPCDHSRPIVGVYGNAHGNRGAWPGMLPSNLDTWREGMGIDWMTSRELSQAIPPAYTEFVGLLLLKEVDR